MKIESKLMSATCWQRYRFFLQNNQINTQYNHKVQGSMKQISIKTILISIIMIGQGLSTNAQIQFGQDIDGEANNNYSGYSVSMPDASTVAIGAPYNSGNGNGAGHVRIYHWDGSAWVQKGSDIDGEAANDQSGGSVCMPDANTVAIGAIYNSGNGAYAGHVRIYGWNGNEWVQKGSDIDGEAADDNSGKSVSMPDANTLAVGAYMNDGSGPNAGQVRIYRWNGNMWVQKGSDIDGEMAGDGSGYSVYMPDTNTVAIGAPENDGNGTEAGQARIYHWVGNEWVQKGGDIDGEAFGNNLGFSICMSDSNTIAVGADKNNENGSYAGHVRIYKWNGSSWLQKGCDIDGEAANNYSGYSVSMPDDNTVAIGAPYNSGNGLAAGHVRIYKWNSNAWVQNGVDIDGEASGDKSGYSVSMPDANTVAIGAYNNSGIGTWAGQVRIYKLKGVYAIAYNDINENCIQENEAGLSNSMALINPGNIVVESNNQGRWYIDSLPAGNYTITYDIPANWLATCPATQSFTVVNPDEISHAPDFGLVSTQPCAKPEISVYMPFMRPCISNQKVFISACNEYNATGALNLAYVDVQLGTMLVPQSASVPYTSIGNNTYRFQFGDINPGQCVNFTIDCQVSCNAAMGQTLCVEARLYPADSCVFDTVPDPYPGNFTPCTLPWDHSSLQVEGYCQNDSIYFIITNTGNLGNGDMDCWSPVRIYIDGVFTTLDSIQLVGGDSIVFAFPGDGRTWRLEADQHPLHPGNSHPNTTVEACGDTGNWTPGLVTVLPQDDADPVVDIYCGVVTTSYDPNDKTGYPTGTTFYHFIYPNQQIQYVIRFQNTGTDTAFTVIVRDTLDTDLDIFSVVPGVASHNYDFQMYGPRVLEWRFSNILLPDSNHSEPDSHGFLTFTVNQMLNLPEGTIITNEADIYFDYNAPVVTNNTLHIVNYFIQTNNVVSITAIDNSYDILVYPNPITTEINIVSNKSITGSDYSIFDYTGRIVRTGKIESETQGISLGNLEKGVYILQIGKSRKLTYKIVKN